jgi:hypothetical protein
MSKYGPNPDGSWTIDDSPVLYDRDPKKHQGPGAHPGTGTDQDVHGGGGGGSQEDESNGEVASGLLDRINASGGATYQPTLNFSPTTGFVVSRFPQWSKIIDAADFRAIDIAKYLAKHRDKWRDKTLHFGAWLDGEENKVWLDIVEVLKSRQEAIDSAVAANQKAIFDLETGEEIPTGGTGRAFAMNMSKEKGDSRFTIVSVTPDDEGLAKLAIQTFEALMGRKATPAEVEEVEREFDLGERKTVKRFPRTKLTRSSVKAAMADLQLTQIQSAIPKFSRFFRNVTSDVIKNLLELGAVPQTVDVIFPSPSELKSQLLATVAEPLVENVVRGYMTEMELFDRVRGKSVKETTAQEVLRILGIDTIGELFSFSVPDATVQQAVLQIAAAFEQPYWQQVIETTRNDIQRSLIQSIAEGWSVKRVAQHINDRHGAEYSLTRATLVARTEIPDALNRGHVNAISEIARTTPELPMGKEWLSVFAQTSRDSHMAMDGTIVPADEMFVLNGVECSHPGHYVLPAKDRCNCLCTVLSAFLVKELGIGT